MSDRTRIAISKEADQLLADVQAFALQNPHTAVLSTNQQFKTNFYNVYPNDAGEKFLQERLGTGFEAYELVSVLIQMGFTVKVIPRNKHGYCQCTISRSSGEDSRLTDTLTGEAGKAQMAILVAFVKMALVAGYTDEGDVYWNARRMNAIDESGFR